MSRVLVKASTAFGRRRLLRNTDCIVCLDIREGQSFFTQTRTVMIVRHFGRSKGADGQKRHIFKYGVQTRAKVSGQKWGKMQHGVYGRMTKNTLVESHSIDPGTSINMAPSRLLRFNLCCATYHTRVCHPEHSVAVSTSTTLVWQCFCSFLGQSLNPVAEVGSLWVLRLSHSLQLGKLLEHHAAQTHQKHRPDQWELWFPS